MKIYSKSVFDWATCTRLDALCEWHEYEGPLTLCDSGGSAPPPPDPRITSAAQTQSNKDTGAFNAALNSGNTYTPLGTQTRTLRGTDPRTGAPIYDTTMALSPEQQNLYSQQAHQNLALGNVAQGMIGQVGSAYHNPLAAPSPGLTTSINTQGMQQLPGAQNLMGDLQNTQNAVYNRQRGFLDPQFQQAKSGLDAELAAKGITEGSDAYSNAQGNFSRQKEFSYGQARDSAIAAGGAEQSRLNSMAQGNRAQQYGEALSSGSFGNSANAQQLQQLFALRNQPLNEFNALRSASPVSMPQFGNGMAAGGIAPTDVSGNIWNAYNGQMNSYNAAQGTANANTAAGAGLAGTALMGAVLF